MIYTKTIKNSLQCSVRDLQRAINSMLLKEVRVTFYSSTNNLNIPSKENTVGETVCLVLLYMNLMFKNGTSSWLSE